MAQTRPRTRPTPAAHGPRDIQGTLFGPDAIHADQEAWNRLLAPAPRCEHCGRPLTTPDSRAAGVGPGCAAKTGRAINANRRRGRATRTHRATAHTGT